MLNFPQNRVWVENRIVFGSSLVADLADENDVVLDIGCRDEILKDYLPSSIEYVGIDIYPQKENSIYSDAEEKIPFADNQISVSVALDVLEHTNKIEKAITEIRRVTRHTYIINLPNELSLIPRFKLLFGVISGKFKINLKSADRHRWFFNLENVRLLIEQTELSSDDVQVFALYRKRKNFLSHFLFRVGYFLRMDSLFAHSFVIMGKKVS